MDYNTTLEQNSQESTLTTTSEYPAIHNPEQVPLLPDSVRKQSHARRQLHFLSNLRIILTALVVLHHSAIPYGGLGAWSFKSKCFTRTSTGLAMFNAIDQTFFMGLFFSMAGYFTHQSLRKLLMTQKDPSPHAIANSISTRTRFISQRCQRLFIPAIAYTLLIDPTIRLLIHLYHHPGTSLITITSFVTHYYTTLRGLRGPVWFPALLFIFDTLAALALPFLLPRFSALTLTKNTLVFISFTATTLFSFLLRIPYPVGTKFLLLNLQVAFLPQYILAYSVGHISAATDNLYLYSLITTPSQKPLRRLAISIFTMIASFGAIITIARHIAQQGMGSKDRSMVDDEVTQMLSGGFNVSALLCAAFNEVGYLTIGASLVALCQRYFGQPWTVKLLGRKVVLARYCYAVFLIHVFVSVAVEIGVEKVVSCEMARSMGAVGMMIVVGSVNVICSG